jgi:hypothetical protein
MRSGWLNGLVYDWEGACSGVGGCLSSGQPMQDFAMSDCQDRNSPDQDHQGQDKQQSTVILNHDPQFGQVAHDRTTNHTQAQQCTERCESRISSSTLAMSSAIPEPIRPQGSSPSVSKM